MKFFNPRRAAIFWVTMAAFSCVVLSAASLPKLKVKNLDGQKENLKQFDGRIIVLNFWATWCGPCKDEMPMLVKEEARYRERGVQVVGVSVDKPGDEDKVRAFIKKYGVTFPVWVGGSADDLDRWKMGPAVPATAFIDQSGEIVGRVEGEMRQLKLEHRLDWMLGDHQGSPPPDLENNLNVSK
jgi:thiol-disulfide isomerase/thioredoxin